MFSFLGTKGGQIGTLEAIILSGMLCIQYGMPVGEHITIAALSVLLVELKSGGPMAYCSRLAALIGLALIGFAGVCFHISIGEHILLAALAVFFVVIQDSPAKS